MSVNNDAMIASGWRGWALVAASYLGPVLVGLIFEALRNA